MLSLSLSLSLSLYGQSSVVEAQSSVVEAELISHTYGEPTAEYAGNGPTGLQPARNGPDAGTSNSITTSNGGKQTPNDSLL